MKDTIKYYYGINVIEYNEKNEKILIRDEYRTYLLKKTYKSESEITNLIDILNKNSFVYYKVIKNNLGEYLIEYKNGKYILSEIWECNKKIGLNFYKKRIGKVKIELYSMWKNKIDSFRLIYEKNKVKYKEIKDLYLYYLGMAENALKMLNKYVEGEMLDVYLQHYRINKEIIALNYFSIDEMVIDSRSRDVAEYCKKIFFEKETKIEVEDLMNFVKMEKYDEKEIYLLVIRLLYPNYFFDLVENELIDYGRIIKNRINFEKFVKKLMDVYINRVNNEINFWIKKVEL